MQDQLALLYQRASLGAELKQVKAMLSNRSRDFKAYTANGERIDLNHEVERFRSMFANSTRVRLDTKIEQASQDRTGVTCRVKQVLIIEQPDPVRGQLMTILLVTQAVDRWQPVNGKHRLVRTQLLSQSLGQGPPLPEDKRWPMQPDPKK